MRAFSEEEFRLIRELLHDAVLEEVVWDQTLATFKVRFNCLRQSGTDSELSDRAVEFNLAGVQVVAVGYDSSDLAARPSRFDPPQRITAEALADWPFRPQEATLWINSAMVQDAVASARLEWLDGDEQALRDAACTFCIVFDQWGDFGLPMLHVRLVIGGESFTITSGGVPLGLDEWTKQFEAWWTGWKAHWDAKTAERKENESVEYETCIPAGQPESPNLTYQPPREPAFALEPTDAPPEVVGAIRDWFESHHERDWLRLARVYPHADRSLEERAAELESWKMGHEFGRWGYARSVDEWWLEGPRACAVVRGIEHSMPCEGDPEENRETVWTFGLRLRNGVWTVDTYSQGWPGFGSAKKLSGRQKPWLRRWTSGEVK